MTAGSAARRARAFVRTPSPRAISSTTAALLAAAAVVLYRFDPRVWDFYPRCMAYVLVGVYCPGCGGLRAWHALLHGDLMAALGSNALAVLAAPFIAVSMFGGRATGDQRRGRQHLDAVRARIAWLIVAGVLAFTLLRNLPFVPFSLLAP